MNHKMGAYVRIGVSVFLMIGSVQGLAAGTGLGLQPDADIIRVQLQDESVVLGLDALAFDRDMVVAVQGRSTTLNYQLIRWQRKGGMVTLRSTPPGREFESQPRWLEKSIVIGRFPIVSCGTLAAAVCIDATPLFTPDEAPYGWRLAKGALSLSAKSAVTYPMNAVVEFAGTGSDGRKRWIKWSFVPLPAVPMAKRRYDRRFGFLDPAFMAFENLRDHEKPPTLPILRWRLQESGPTRIAMYVDPAAPARWVPWMAKGIESWNPALAAAGWKDAIQVVDASGLEGWSYDDVRNSVMCWGTSNGCGWIIFDPRSGEILQYQMPSSELVVSHFLAPYVVTMAAVDPRILGDARSDEVLGNLIQHTAAHEMGHVLGLRDGHFGMGAYSIEEVRSAEWVRANGFTPSVMNYARFNYVLQSDDEFSPDLVISGIGPADVHAIMRGYAPSGTSSEADRHARWLDALAANPVYRYNIPFITYLTPNEISEAVVTSDLVEEARLGIRNLERSMAMIGNRQVFPDDDETAEFVEPSLLYQAALKQWRDMVKPMMSLVGGYQSRPGINADIVRVDLDADEVQPVPAGTQREAMAYLCKNVLVAPPRFLLDGALRERAGVTLEEAEGKLRELRTRMLDDPLLHPIRLNRLAESEGMDGAFGMSEFVRSLRPCILHSGMERQSSS